ncbi:LemA family protein [uncultured archaeon]|nr:LemA family protein [uncultured archaeon]
MALEIIGYAVGGVVVIGGLWFIVSYNGLVTLKNQIENSWSQIDVQLKRRFDLIPNLMETVKGYAKHEKETFRMVTEARTAVTKAQGFAATAKAENVLSGALKSLFAVSEAYPELKANQNFMMLQEELSGIESKIAYTRQFYNDSVMTFNTRIDVFPDSIVAGMLSFKKKEYFEIAEAEKQNVKVKF